MTSLKSNSRLQKILVVEDEKNICSTLVDRLTEEGYELCFAVNKFEALSILMESTFDLILLDIGLPDGNGFEIAEQVRQNTPQTAVVFLTAFVSPEDRIRGLETGADDYVVKPFHFKELALRIQNILKRRGFIMSQNGVLQKSVITIGLATIDFDKFTAFRNNDLSNTTNLTHKECALIKLLHNAGGKVVSRDEILNQVWSEEEYPTPRTIDNFIMRIRRIVEENPEDPKVIKSVRGVGYQMVKDV